MREMVEPVMHIVDLASQAMKEVGIVPIVKPVRGGTDGAQLSFMGLPCPNITFTDDMSSYLYNPWKKPVMSLYKSLDWLQKNN